MSEARKILVAAVAGAHGVRGEVKIKTFTADPKAFVKYGELADESGERTYRVKVRGQARGLMIARIEGVEDRNAAEAIKGLRLYVDRSRLPKPKRNEWYLSDLVGLRAELKDGANLGVVKATMNYGAGDILEIATKDGKSLLLPFTKRTAPEVDVEQGRIVIDPPDEVEWKPEADAEDE